MANAWGITSAITGNGNASNKVECPLVTITGDFTIDLFVNIARDNPGVGRDLFICGDWGPSANNFQLVWNDSQNQDKTPKSVSFYINGVVVLTSSITADYGWHHMRMSRNGNTGYMWIDGVAAGSGPISGNP